jgi:hypothetical protein
VKQTVRKMIGFFLLLALSLSGASVAADAFWVVEDDMDYKLTEPFKSDDIALFVGQNPELVPEELIKASEGMLNTQSFRIPSLLRTQPKSPNARSTLIAAVDRASSDSDWGKIDIAVRRSGDNGETWSDLQVIMSMPVHEAPQDSEDWKSAFCIDPAMIQAEDGGVVMLVTMFPESKGLHASKWLEETTGYVEIEEEQYMALYADASSVGKSGGKKAVSDEAYAIRENGWIYTPAGEKTKYYVPQNHSDENHFETVGDMYYAMGEQDYLLEAPPIAPAPPAEGDKETDIYVGNIYLSYEQPEFRLDSPQFVQKRLVSPWKEGDEYSAYQTYETAPAPLRAAVTSYVWMLKSYDNGATWKQPVDITPQVKIAQDGGFLGVSPGAGLILSNQSYAGRINRILFPLYKEGKATVVYSDDNGETWVRPSSQYIENVDEAQCIELTNGSLVAFGRQEGLDKTPVSISLDGGQTWRKSKSTDLISVKCQKSLITLPVDNGTESAPFVYPKEMKKGSQYVLSSHPSGGLGKNSERTKGVISLGIVQDDHTIEWIREREIKDYEQYAGLGEYSEFFAYSSMTLLENGNIGLLYEAYPSGYLVFTQFNLDWLLDGSAPEGDHSRISPILWGAVVSVLLLIAGFIVMDTRRKRRLMPPREAVFAPGGEGNAYAEDGYAEDAYEDYAQEELYAEEEVSFAGTAAEGEVNFVEAGARAGGFAVDTAVTSAQAPYEQAPEKAEEVKIYISSNKKEQADDAGGDIPVAKAGNAQKMPDNEEFDEISIGSVKIGKANAAQAKPRPQAANKKKDIPVAKTAKPQNKSQAAQKKPAAPPKQKGEDTAAHKNP